MTAAPMLKERAEATESAGEWTSLAPRNPAAQAQASLMTAFAGIHEAIARGGYDAEITFDPDDLAPATERDTQEAKAFFESFSE